MKRQTIARERRGAIERRTVRVTYAPAEIGRAIHEHTRIGRSPRVLTWRWMGEDERGTGWFGEFWGRGERAQMRRRSSMGTALKAVAESGGGELAGIEPERDGHGRMTGNVLAVRTETLDWGALAGTFSI